MSDAPEGLVLIRQDGTRVPATSVTYSHTQEDGIRVYVVVFPVVPTFPGDRIHADRLPAMTGMRIEVELDIDDEPAAGNLTVTEVSGNVDTACPGCGARVTGDNLVALGMRPEHVTPGGQVLCGLCATPSQFDDRMVLQHLTDEQLRASLASPQYRQARDLVLDNLRRHGNGNPQ